MVNKSKISLFIAILLSNSTVSFAQEMDISRDNPFMPNIIKIPEPQVVVQQPAPSPPPQPIMNHLPDLPMPPKMSQDEELKQIEADYSKNRNFFDGLSVVSISKNGAILRYSKMGSMGGAGAGGMNTEPMTMIKRILLKDGQKLYLGGENVTVKIKDLSVILQIKEPGSKNKLIPVWIGEIEGFRFNYPLTTTSTDANFTPPLSGGVGVKSQSSGSSGGGSSLGGSSLGGSKSAGM